MNSKLLLTLSLLAALRAPAADIVWTNSTGGNWSVGANWNLGRMPGATDRVFITNAGTFTVFVDVAYDGYHDSLQLGGASGTQTLTNANRNLLFRQASYIGPNGRVAWSGGTIGGGGQTTVEGVLGLGGGNWSQPTRIAPGGVLNLSGTANKQVNLVTNEGTMSWAGTGNITSTRMHNRPGGLFEFRGDALFYGLFINEGLVRKSAGTGTSRFYPTGVVTNTGVFEAQTGTITVSGTSRFEPGTAFLGAGTNLCYGNAFFGGAVFSSNLVFGGGGGAIQGHGIFSGVVVWQDVSMDDGASLTIATDGQLVITGPAAKAVGSITNAGQVICRGTGALNLSDSGKVHNLAGATWDLRTNTTISGISGSLFLNDGLVRKTASSGRSDVSADFLNRGTLAIDSGTVRFTGDYLHSNGTIALGGGTFQLAGQPLFLDGGSVTGFGVVSNNVSNAGLIVPTAAGGTLRIVGDLTNTPAGTIAFALGGTTAGVNHSRLQVTGRAALGGSMDVTLVGGFMPQTNEVFQVMTFGSRVGDFGCRNGCYLLGQNRRLVENWTPTSLALATVGAPDPSEPGLCISARPTVLVCWPREFIGYALCWNTNVATTNWMLLVGATNRCLEERLVPEKYFRLLKP